MPHNEEMMTRRAMLQGTLGGAIAMSACSPKKGTGFPGFAIIASEAEHTLSAISLERFTVTRQLQLEASPSQVAAIANPSMVLCLLPSRGTLLAIDSGGVAVRQKVRVGDESLLMHLDDDGKRVWILNKSPNTLVAVDLATFKTGAKVRLPGTAASLDFHGKTGAVSLPAQRAIAIIEGDQVARSIPVDMAPEMILFRQNGDSVIAGDPEGQMLAIVDPASGQLVVKLPLPLKPRRYCSKSDGGELYITGEGMDAVSIVRPYQTEVDQTILVGSAPAGMAVLRPDPKVPEYLFVTNSGSGDSGDLTVIDIESRSAVARISVGQDPQDVVITPDNQYALVLNRKSGDIAVIRIPSIGVSRSDRAMPGWIKRSAASSLFSMIPVGLRPISATVSRIAS